MRAIRVLLMLLALSNVPAFAQFSLGGPTGKMMLVVMPDVQKELKLTSDQKKHIQTTMNSMSAGNMQMPSDMTQLNAQIDGQVLAGLTPDQLSRLQELWIQYNGPKVLQDATVAKALQLTDDQNANVKQIWQDYGQAVMAAMQSRSMSSMNEIKRKKKEADGAALAVLTPDQAKAFVDMQGKAHNFPQASQY